MPTRPVKQSLPHRAPLLPGQGAQGSAMVLVLVMLALLSLIGAAAVMTATLETQIAGNEYHHDVAFYGAEAGAQVAQELLEQNLCCPGGFTATEEDGGALIENEIMVPAASLAFWQTPPPKREDYEDDEEYVADILPENDNRDFFYPADYAAGRPHTNLRVFGETFTSQGSAIMMAAGYEGIGKGAAGGGAYKLYDIYAQRRQRHHVAATVRIQWKHQIILSREGPCVY